MVAVDEHVPPEDDVSAGMSCTYQCTLCTIIFRAPPSPLQVCCGDRKVPGRHAVVPLPSPAALAEFQSVNSAPPCDPAKFALRLLGIFFTTEQLSVSNCTKAEGRELLDPKILQAIKGKGE